MRDLEEVVVAAENGVPIFVRQVADGEARGCVPGGRARQGTEEAWAAVVVARYGVSTVDVISG